MKKLSITTRIVLIATIPLLAFIIMGAIIVEQQNSERQVLKSMQQNTRLFTSTSRLMGDLQRERGRTALLHSGGATLADVVDLRKKTDDGFKDWGESLKNADLADSKALEAAKSVPQVLAGSGKRTNSLIRASVTRPFRIIQPSSRRSSTFSRI